MSFISLPSEYGNPPEIQEIFDELIAKVGKVPAAYRAFATHAHILQANWNRTKNIMGKGNLSIQLKESIATRVSAENGCHFCLAIHQKNLEKMGWSKEEIEGISSGTVVNSRSLQNTNDSLQAVLDFVTTATKNPHDLSEKNFDTLKTLGFSEADIVEMLTVMEMYTGYNKIIVALGLHLDD